MFVSGRRPTPHISVFLTAAISIALCLFSVSAPSAQVAIGDYFYTTAGTPCPINTRSCDVTFNSFPADQVTTISMLTCRILTTATLVRMEVLPASYSGKVREMPIAVPSYYSQVNESSLDQRLYVVQVPVDFRLAKADRLVVNILFSAPIPHLQSSSACAVSGRLSAK